MCGVKFWRQPEACTDNKSRPSLTDRASAVADAVDFGGWPKLFYRKHVKFHIAAKMYRQTLRH